MRAVDLFAGAGGFTEGARMAGVQVVWAANHWLPAVQVHWANHKETAHVCQDLQQANWAAVPEHDVLLASPACQGHSHARGVDRPHHDAARSTAWAVVACAEVHLPKCLVVENVPEFLKWRLYGAWEMALRSLGYGLTVCQVDAADHGVPQHRKRVFVVGVQGGKSFSLNLPRREHVPVSFVIDPAADGWVPVAVKCAKTRAVVKAGRRDFGDRFVFSYYGTTSTGRSLARPLGTVTTRERWALVEGDRMRMLSVPEYRAAMGFRSDYVLPTGRKLATHLLGNAVCPPVARDIVTALRGVL